MNVPVILSLVLLTRVHVSADLYSDSTHARH